MTLNGYFMLKSIFSYQGCRGVARLLCVS